MIQTEGHLANFLDWKRERGLEPSFPFLDRDVTKSPKEEVDWLVVHVQVDSNNKIEQQSLAKKVAIAIGAKAKLATLDLTSTSCQVLYEVISYISPARGTLVMVDENHLPASDFFIKHYAPHLNCRIVFGPSAGSMLLQPSRKIELWKMIQEQLIQSP